METNFPGLLASIFLFFSRCNISSSTRCKTPSLSGVNLPLVMVRRNDGAATKRFLAISGRYICRVFRFVDIRLRRKAIRNHDFCVTSGVNFAPPTAASS
ncbi:hypothetical protein DFP73DRAFT_301071 [Morchella snyderi]|nr:hypothetical protein DFP73DRAFT_301071 [Morchella snyderi]